VTEFAWSGCQDIDIELILPQHQTPDDTSVAHALSCPAEIVVNAWPPVTATGVDAMVPVPKRPSPRPPNSPEPQQYVAPDESKLHVWYAPGLTLAYLPGVPFVLTATGTLRFVVVPSPTWPFAFNPQHKVAPAAVCPQVCQPPAVTDVNVAVPDTLTGDGRTLSRPSPT
jgi:hypothetical protein